MHLFKPNTEANKYFEALGREPLAVEHLRLVVVVLSRSDEGLFTLTREDYWGQAA